MHPLRLVLASILAGLLTLRPMAQDTAIPVDPRQLTAPIPFATWEAVVRQADLADHVTLTEVGKSIEARPLYLVRLAHPGVESSPKAWRLLFVGQQHGDEPSGKDALVYLIRRYAEHPEELPGDVELYIMPSVNPDGGEANKRRNAAGADLNRDHALLLQPETQVLHQVARRLQPHVFVDCHEFRRDTADFAEKGWSEWPLIMMDCANHPAYPRGLFEAGIRWVDSAMAPMERAGFPYMRYNIADAPPGGETRYSTLDPDDARNGIGAYGGLSFIIEAGVYRGSNEPQKDIGERVSAFLLLLGRFIENDAHRAEEIELIAKSRAAALPEFLPVNYFWGNVGQRTTNVKVVEVATGAIREIPMANFMHDRIVKRSVATPAGYVVEATAATAFREILDRHAIPFKTINELRVFQAERAKLLRLEEEEDPIYQRYGGRQIVQLDPPAQQQFQPGSLFVRLQDDNSSLRAAVLLEPAALHGLYQFPQFRALVGADGTIPVWRVIE